MNVLSIGGSDPSSGAGIQGDIRTSQQLGAYCLTAVTAVTSQNTSEYSATAPVPPETVRDQIGSVVSDFHIDVIKIGMVYDSETISAVCDALGSADAPIVVDPVMMSTTGGTLLKKEALQPYREGIVPLASAITPNVAEAEAVSGMGSAGGRNVEGIAGRILEMGAKGVVVTGIDGGEMISDYVRTGSEGHRISSRKTGGENHGGGCVFSTALAVRMAAGDGIVEAAAYAGRFAKRSIEGAQRIGAGVRIAGPAPQNGIRGELAAGISEFTGVKNVQDLIPECQTNFVYSAEGPRSVMDIAGLAGRIVRAGDGVVVAGELAFGGSRHVAAAVLAVNKRFPGIRSGINIRYDAGIISRMRAGGMRVASYDRGTEPKEVRDKENSSVAWGTAAAVAGAAEAPDVIFHEGGIGKEPMILVFGETPQRVVDKIRALCGEPGGRGFQIVESKK